MNSNTTMKFLFNFINVKLGHFKIDKKNFGLAFVEWGT